MCAEYRTVSGVAGPLVILDKVKVCVVFLTMLLITLQFFINSVYEPLILNLTACVSIFRAQSTRKS